MSRPSSVRVIPSLLRVGRRFWPLLRTQRLAATGAVAALLAEVALRALEPWPLKYVFDEVLGRSRGQDTIPVLVGAALALVLLVGGRAYAAYWSTLGFSRTGNRLLSQVREQLYQHLTRLSLGFHTRQRNGDLVLRLGRDVDLLKEVLVSALLPLLGNLLILVVMAGLMIWLEWRLAALALLVLPLFYLVSGRLAPRIHESARRQRRREGLVTSGAAEALGAIRVVQALSLEQALGRSFGQQNRASAEDDVRGRQLAAQLERSVDLLVALGTALVLAAGAGLVLDGSLTAGELLVFLSYLKSGFRPLQDVAKYTGRLARAAAAGERILELLDRDPEVRDCPGAMAAPPLCGAIRFDRVGFGYERDRPVLDGVSVEAPPGSRIAIVGSSGAGKSTLASLVLRLADPWTGRVLLDGADIREFTLASVRAQVSVVLQDTILFHATVGENIGLGRPGATPAEVEAAARLASAHEFIAQLPQGYDTLVGERGLTLSAGQRQRIALARAALRRAPIVILDEPTTGLDAENARAVTEALTRFADGATLLVVTHDAALAATLDTEWRLHHGQVTVVRRSHALAS